MQDLDFGIGTLMVYYSDHAIYDIQLVRYICLPIFDIEFHFDAMEVCLGLYEPNVLQARRDFWVRHILLALAHYYRNHSIYDIHVLFQSFCPIVDNDDMRLIGIFLFLLRQ